MALTLTESNNERESSLECHVQSVTGGYHRSELGLVVIIIILMMMMMMMIMIIIKNFNRRSSHVTMAQSAVA